MGRACPNLVEFGQPVLEDDPDRGRPLKPISDLSQSVGPGGSVAQSNCVTNFRVFRCRLRCPLAMSKIVPHETDSRPGPSQDEASAKHIDFGEYDTMEKMVSAYMKNPETYIRETARARVGHIWGPAFTRRRGSSRAHTLTSSARPGPEKSRQNQNMTTVIEGEQQQ